MFVACDKQMMTEFSETLPTLSLMDAIFVLYNLCGHFFLLVPEQSLECSFLRGAFYVAALLFDNSLNLIRKIFLHLNGMAFGPFFDFEAQPSNSLRLSSRFLC